MYCSMRKNKKKIIYRHVNPSFINVSIAAVDDNDITCENGLVNWDDDKPKCECWSNYYGKRCEIRKYVIIFDFDGRQSQITMLLRGINTVFSKLVLQHYDTCNVII